MNPYDPCIANMMTKGGKQLRVVWHVDDLIVSCEDDFELTKFSCYLGSIYGMKLSMHMGRKHDYLGVDMEFCEDGALEVSMFKYLKNVIKEFPEIIRGRAATPAHPVSGTTAARHHGGPARPSAAPPRPKWPRTSCVNWVGTITI